MIFHNKSLTGKLISAIFLKTKEMVSRFFAIFANVKEQNERTMTRKNYGYKKPFDYKIIIYGDEIEIMEIIDDDIL